MIYILVQGNIDIGRDVKLANIFSKIDFMYIPYSVGLYFTKMYRMLIL